MLNRLWVEYYLKSLLRILFFCNGFEIVLYLGMKHFKFNPAIGVVDGLLLFCNLQILKISLCTNIHP